jgi:hypothetical protein
MPLYMGVHNIEVGMSAAELAKAHQANLATQGRHGVDYQHYWVNEKAGKAFCLVEAPNPEAANTVHREANGLVAGEIFEVVEQTLRSVHSDKLVDPSPSVFVVSPSPRDPRPSGVLERNVRRTVERPFASINSAIENSSKFTAGRVVVVSGLGKMIFDSTFQRLEFCGMAMLQTRGRLVGRGPRICRYARIEVELTPWSVRTTEVRISPRSRFVHLWGVRRSRRYWLLAHGAANVLKEMLLTGGPSDNACRE